MPPMYFLNSLFLHIFQNILNFVKLTGHETETLPCNIFVIYLSDALNDLDSKFSI